MDSHVGLKLLVIFAFFMGLLYGYLLGKGSAREKQSIENERKETEKLRKRIAVLQARLLRMF